MHDADAKTIKRAFLKQARTLHPDVNQAPDAERKFDQPGNTDLGRVI